MIPNLPEGWFSPTDQKVYRELVTNLKDNSKLIEIGVWKGRSLASVSDILIEKNIKVYAVDTFKGSENEPILTQEAVQINVYELFVSNMKKCGLVKQLEVVPMTSLEASFKFPKEYFDLIFIDADHSYEAVKQDLEMWYPKLKTGGTIGGHDYCNNVGSGVVSAVGEFFGEDSIEIKNVVWMKKKL